MIRAYRGDGSYEIEKGAERYQTVSKLVRECQSCQRVIADQRES